MALTEVNSLGIKDGEVKTADIAADAITTAKIADDAVTAAKIGPLAGDVTLDNGTNAGKDITWDESADTLKLEDSVYLKIGNGGDLSIYHDGSNSYIHESGTGDLVINSDSTVSINPNGGGEYGFRVHTNGACDAYYDNVKTFYTTGSGIVAQGPEGGDGMVYIYADEGDDDADKWRNIAVNDGTFHIQNLASGSWETNIECNGNGNVELYYDASKKLETIGTGLNVTGGIRLGGNNAANELDDYEEGTFTPTTNDNFTGGSKGGFYVKVGHMVTCNMKLSWTGNGGQGGGVWIAALPFSTYNSGDMRCAVTVGYTFGYDNDGNKQLVGWMDNNNNAIYIGWVSDNASLTATGAQNASTAGEVHLSCTFRTN